MEPETEFQLVIKSKLDNLASNNISFNLITKTNGKNVSKAIIIFSFPLPSYVWRDTLHMHPVIYDKYPL